MTKLYVLLETANISDIVVCTLLTAMDGVDKNLRSSRANGSPVSPFSSPALSLMVLLAKNTRNLVNGSSIIVTVILNTEWNIDICVAPTGVSQNEIPTSAFMR